MWKTLQAASLTVQCSHGPLNLETVLPVKLWNIDFEILCAIGNNGQGDTMISPQSAVKYGLWMFLALYEIARITSRCWCTDCRGTSAVIQLEYDPNLVASVLQDVVSTMEDKNEDFVVYGDRLARVLSCDLLCFLADDEYPMELNELGWMFGPVRAQIRQLIRLLMEREGIPNLFGYRWLSIRMSIRP